MPIILTEPIMIAGALVPVDGTTKTYNAAFEADQVAAGKAKWAAGSPAVGNRRIPLEVETTSAQGLVESYGGDSILRFKPWSAYKAMYRFDQAVGSGSPLDCSGNGNHAILRSGYTDDGSGIWSNAGYGTTKNGSDQWAMIPESVARFDLLTQSQMVHMAFKMAAPASEIFSLVTFGSSSQKGWYVGATTAGKLKFSYRDTAGSNTAGVTNAVVFDGTDHHVTICIDGELNDIYICVDGVVDIVYPYRIVKGNDITFPVGYRAGIGGGISNSDAASNGTATQMLIKNMHIAVLKGGLPLNWLELVKRMYRDPAGLIPDGLPVGRLKPARQIITIGQSVLAGAGPTPDRTVAWGPYVADPILPISQAANPKYRSMLPRLVEQLARKRGHWVKPYNSAQGGTSIVDSWVGRIRNWVASMKVCIGTYVLSNGGVWRCSLGNNNIIASTVAPSGTADTTGADAIPWTYLGAPSASDVPGVLYEGHPRFDPRGLIASAALAISSLLGFSERWLLIEFGQNDGAMYNPRADWAAAHIAVANYFLARGVKVLLGLAPYTAQGGGTIEAWYQSDLMPGLADALAQFSGSASVFPGANLRTALGVLTANGVRGIQELQTDGYHPTDELYKNVSDLHFDALVATGQW